MLKINQRSAHNGSNHLNRALVHARWLTKVEGKLNKRRVSHTGFIANMIGLSHKVHKWNTYPEQFFNSIKPANKFDPEYNLPPLFTGLQSNGKKYNDDGNVIKRGYIKSYDRYTSTINKDIILPGDTTTEFSEGLESIAFSLKNPMLTKRIGDLPLMLKAEEHQAAGFNDISILELIHGPTDAKRLEDMQKGSGEQTYFVRDDKKVAEGMEYWWYDVNPRTSNYYTKYYNIPISLNSKAVGSTNVNIAPFKVPTSKSFLANVTLVKTTKESKIKKKFYVYDVEWESRMYDEIMRLDFNYIPYNQKRYERSLGKIAYGRSPSNNYFVYEGEEDEIKHTLKGQAITKRLVVKVQSMMFPGGVQTRPDVHHCRSLFGKFDNERDDDSLDATFARNTNNNYCSDINEILDDMTPETVNYTVLSLMLRSRFEQDMYGDAYKYISLKTSVTSWGRVDVKIDYEDRSFYNNNMDFLTPELNNTGRVMMLEIVKRTIIDDCTAFSPQAFNEGDVIVSKIALESATELKYWMVALFCNTRHMSLTDKMVMPYFVPKLKDDEGEEVISIRLDISRGEKCSYLVPHLDILSDGLKLEDDVLFKNLSTYMEILTPLLDDMRNEQIISLDECYPVATIASKLFDNIFDLYDESELPKLVNGLDTNISLDIITRIGEHIKENIDANLDSDFQANKINMREMIKEVGLEKEAEGIDFSGVILPKVGPTPSKGKAKYQIVKDGNVKQLDDVSISDKLYMLQDATDLLDKFDESQPKARAKVYKAFIKPIVDSMKAHKDFDPSTISAVLSDMMMIKEKLDYVRTNDLEFMRKKKKILIGLFMSQKNVLKRRLDADSELATDYEKVMNTIDLSMDEYTLDDVLKMSQVDTSLAEETMAIRSQAVDLKNKAFAIGITGLAVGGIIKLVRSFKGGK